jgi:hypothetical protein
MRSTSWWLPCGLLALSVLACNQILENKKGVLDLETPASETSPTQPPETAGETATAPEGSNDAPSRSDAGVAMPRASSDAGDGCSDPTNGASKSCGLLCVSREDPVYGCAAADCSPCAVEGAVAACVNGACSISVCMAGRADCNSNDADGCEANLNAPTSCGACGVQCPAAPHAVPACEASSCAITCEPGWADCNHDPMDGCEINLAGDIAHCGQCGNRCVVGRCLGGGCTIF